MLCPNHKDFPNKHVLSIQALHTLTKMYDGNSINYKLNIELLHLFEQIIKGMKQSQSFYSILFSN